MKKPVVIGIAGGSGSGKSTVLRRIMEDLAPNSIAVLEHDAYYRDLAHLPREERIKVNFDHPDSLETPLMLAHLKDLVDWKPIEKPTYDFNNHIRHTETVCVEPRPVIVLDGILVLAERELAGMMDIRIYVDTDSDVRLLRRIRRDMIERGRTIEAVLEQYERTVRPMHLQFVEPSKRLADIIIPRGGHNVVAIEMLLARIRHLLGQ